MIKLKLTVMPPSVNTMWINKPKGRYKSKRGKEFEKEALYEIKRQYKGKLLTGRLKMNLRLFFKGKTKRDIDNYNKGILDALTGIIYADDEQIEELNILKKTDNPENKIEIEIYERS